jgi:hypothetical protein
MPPVVRIEHTPNPLAMKFVTGGPARAAIMSYRSRGDAPAPTVDPLGAAIFAVGGVSSVLVGTEWVAVNIAPGTDWKGTRDRVRRAIESIV